MCRKKVMLPCALAGLILFSVPAYCAAPPKNTEQIATQEDAAINSIKFYDRLYRASHGRIGDQFISYEDAQEVLLSMPNGNQEFMNFSQAKVVYQAQGKKKVIKIIPQEVIEPIPLYYKMHSRFLAPTMLE